MGLNTSNIIKAIGSFLAEAEAGRPEHISTGSFTPSEDYSYLLLHNLVWILLCWQEGTAESGENSSGDHPLYISNLQVDSSQHYGGLHSSYKLWSIKTGTARLTCSFNPDAVRLVNSNPHFCPAVNMLLCTVLLICSHSLTVLKHNIYSLHFYIVYLTVSYLWVFSGLSTRLLNCMLPVLTTVFVAVTRNDNKKP